MSKKVKCPGCGREISVLLDGTLRLHKRDQMDTSMCKGSGRFPGSRIPKSSPTPGSPPLAKGQVSTLSRYIEAVRDAERNAREAREEMFHAVAAIAEEGGSQSEMARMIGQTRQNLSLIVHRYRGRTYVRPVDFIPKPGKRSGTPSSKRWRDMLVVRANNGDDIPIAALHAIDPELKIAIAEAMGFIPRRDEHSRECPEEWSLPGYVSSHTEEDGS